MRRALVVLAGALLAGGVGAALALRSPAVQDGCHLTPPPPSAFVERVFVRGVDAVRPDGWRLGRDGLTVELPVGSDEVRVGRLE